MLSTISQYATRLHQMAEKFLWYSKTHLYTESVRRGLPGSAAQEAIESAASEKAAQMFRPDDLIIEIEQAEIQMVDECLQKIVIELVENAFKFSSPGKKVTVQGRVQEDEYVLKVIDYGRGMTREQIDLIGGFMQFERSIQEQQGTGLGLIISRRLVEIFDGKFSVHSVPDRGTIISIRLPCKVVAGAVPAQTDEKPVTSMRL
jgi:K+-sensing histidine kinase KdpD